MDERQDYNRAILKMLQIMVDKYPDYRFNQLLLKMGIGKDNFYIESSDTYNICWKKFSNDMAE